MIYFFSDSHIGSRAMTSVSGQWEQGSPEARMEHQQKVIRMLEMMSRDAEEIHILGDLFDFWYEYLWPDSSKDEYTPLLDCLRSLTDRGIRIHFYIGNHDMWTFGALARRTGMTVHKKNVQQTTCYGRRIVLGHGDGLVPANFLDIIPPEYHSRIRRFIWLRRFFHNPVPQWLFRLMPPRWGNRIGYEWSRRSRLKELAHPCGYKGENNEELVLWAKTITPSQTDTNTSQTDTTNTTNTPQTDTNDTTNTPQTDTNDTTQAKTPTPTLFMGNLVDYFIFGHRHIELDLELASGSHVIILGDTWQQWTYATLSPDGKVQLMVWEDQ